MGKQSVISKKRFAVLGLIVAFILTVLPEYGVGATVSTRSLTSGKSKSAKVSEGPRARKRLSRLSKSRGRTVRTARARRHRRRHYERFTASSFTNGDITEGDVTEGEDPIVRQAAIDALGNMHDSGGADTTGCAMLMTSAVAIFLSWSRDTLPAPIRFCWLPVGRTISPVVSRRSSVRDCSSQVS